MRRTADRADRAYEIRLSGRVSQAEVEAALDHVVEHHELWTMVRGRFADQASLYRALRLARCYGLEVVDLHRVTRTGSPPRLSEQP